MRKVQPVAVRCLGSKRGHGPICAFGFGHCGELAAKHVYWGASCALLCARHARAVERSAKRQHRDCQVTDAVEPRQPVLFPVRDGKMLAAGES